MDPSALITPAVTVAASFLGAWLAARLALYRFYDEQIWERRADAYKVIFEKLHDMSQWYDIHLSATMRNREIPEDEAAKLSEEHKKARSNFSRRLARDTWIISDESRASLDQLEVSLK